MKERKIFRRPGRLVHIVLQFFFSLTVNVFDIYLLIFLYKCLI